MHTSNTKWTLGLKKRNRTYEIGREVGGGVREEMEKEWDVNLIKTIYASIKFLINKKIKNENKEINA